MKRISPAEAHQLMSEGWTYIDVRSRPEFSQGHPQGSVNVPLLDAGPAGMVPNPAFLQTMEKRFPKAERLIIGCQAGGRSVRATQMLEAAGYTQLVEQRCGFGGGRDAAGNPEPGWAAAGLPVATGE